MTGLVHIFCHAVLNPGGSHERQGPRAVLPVTINAILALLACPAKDPLGTAARQEATVDDARDEISYKKQRRDFPKAVTCAGDVNK